MRTRVFAAVLAIFCLMSVSCSFAETVAPCADLVFADAFAILYAGKYVTFTASTYGVSNTISVTAVQLEQKVNGEWSFVTTLTCPDSQTDCLRYAQTAYYTSEIGTGTYRIVATFCADGHTITRTSNERTY